MNAISCGSSQKPLSSPRSAAPKKRTSSWRKPISGPGLPDSGDVWPHGPISPRERPGTCSSIRSTASRYPSTQPPIAKTSQLIRSWCSQADPTRQ